MRKISPKSRLQRGILHFALIAIGYFYAYPFIWMLSGSLKTRTEFYEFNLRLLPNQPVWSNYADAWQMASFSVYFKNSVIVSVTATLIAVALTSMAGYALARSDYSGKKVILAAMVLTMFLPKGYAIIPIFELVRELGLLNTLWAVILVNVGTSMVVSTLLFVGYFATFPQELEEAARIDGAGPLTTYWRIALPLAKPMIGTVVLFEFIDNWNSFFIPLIFTLGRPELRTVGVGMYAFVGQHSTNWTLMCAAATMSLMPTLILFFLLQRLFVEGVVGAIRG